MSMKIKINCLFCDNEMWIFPSRVGRSKFCSRECAGSYYGDKLAERNAGRGSGHKIVSCEYCGKEIVRTNRRIRVYGRQYCSIPCKQQGQVMHISETCLVCGESFTVHPSDQAKSANGGKYCSQKCAKIANGDKQRGEQNPQWRGGVTPENKRARESKEMKQWKVNVFDRDKYTCQSCGKKGGYLHAHHKKHFSLYPELRFDPENGETLCRQCHKIEHGRIGWRNERESSGINCQA